MATEDKFMTPEEALEKRINPNNPDYVEISDETWRSEQIKEMIKWGTDTRRDFNRYQEMMSDKRARRNICFASAVIYGLLLIITTAIIGGYIAFKLDTVEGLLIWGLSIPIVVLVYLHTIRTNFRVNGNILD